MLKALLAAKEASDPAGWQAFQADASRLKLQRTRLEGEAAELDNALAVAEREVAKRQARARAAASASAAAAGGVAAASGVAASGSGAALKPVRIVLISGFESFNVDLYRKAAQQIKAQAPHVSLKVGELAMGVHSHPCRMC